MRVAVHSIRPVVNTRALARPKQFAPHDPPGAGMTGPTNGVARPGMGLVTMVNVLPAASPPAMQTGPPVIEAPVNSS